jgi:hypothetical protein
MRKMREEMEKERDIMNGNINKLQEDSLKR